MTNLDIFEISADGNFYINNRSLIDIVKEIEIACITKDCEEYQYVPEEDEDPYLIAGSYMPIPLWMIQFPSRYLLDEPKDFTCRFGINLDDPRRNKTTLLGCPCTEIECWFLLAKVTLTEKTVTWSDFNQFHRDEWQYNLNFTFDRKQYESQLNKIFI